MEENVNINTLFKKSFYYIFHFPLDEIYNFFRTPNLILKTFFQKAKITSILPDSKLDDIGNTISILWDNLYNFSFKVDNVTSLPYFKSFTHKSLYNPPFFSDFKNTFSFYWNSLDKVTIFKFVSTQENKKLKNIIGEDIYNDKDYICCYTEKYLIENKKNFEENESISILKSIDNVWEFISNINNQIYFYPNEVVKINIINQENFEVIEINNKFIYSFKITKKENNYDKKELICELVNQSKFNLPKQKVLMILIRIDDNKCFFIFKHIILEYIPFDILMSISDIKKKILKKIKNIIEC